MRLKSLYTDKSIAKLLMKQGKKMNVIIEKQDNYTYQWIKETMKKVFKQSNYEEEKLQAEMKLLRCKNFSCGNFISVLVSIVALMYVVSSYKMNIQTYLIIFLPIIIFICIAMGVTHMMMSEYKEISFYTLKIQCINELIEQRRKDTSETLRCKVKKCKF